MNQASDGPRTLVWRLVRSAWQLPAFLLLGFGTWASFLYIGKTAQNTKWKRAAFGYGAALILAFAISDGAAELETTRDDISAYIVIAVWLVGIVHSIRVNKQWLAWCSERDAGSGGSPLASRNLPAPQPRLQNQVPLVPENLALRDMERINQSQASASFSSVDLNACSLDDLVSTLGLTTQQAIQVLETRASLGGYSAIEQLMTEAKMEPHVFVTVRDRIVVARRAENRRLGRRLDL